MGKKAKGEGGGGGGDGAERKEAVEKEGHNLLGSPTFEELENGRFKCLETGHELPAHARDSYALTKHCRLGLINTALSLNKPPLNIFNQDPHSSSKLICKLTGVTINKSEEHIWKHINGKRFLNMLERAEAEQASPKEIMEKPENQKPGNKKKKAQVDGLKEKKKKEEKSFDEALSEVRDSSVKHNTSEEADNLWMPPAGNRWDCDDGHDRWGSSPELDQENGDAESNGGGTEEGENNAQELAKQTKRISLEMGPSCCATRKKKRKTKSS